MSNLRKISLLGLLLSCSLTSLGSPICSASPTEAHRVLMTENPFAQSTTPTPARPNSQASTRPNPQTSTPIRPSSTAQQRSSTPQTESVQSVNINQADAATLAQVLVGIGEKKAQAIIEYRQAHGAFSTIEQLDQVKGIGAATIEKNRARIRLR